MLKQSQMKFADEKIEIFFYQERFITLKLNKKILTIIIVRLTVLQN